MGIIQEQCCHCRKIWTCTGSQQTQAEVPQSLCLLIMVAPWPLQNSAQYPLLSLQECTRWDFIFCCMFHSISRVVSEVLQASGIAFAYCRDASRCSISRVAQSLKPVWWSACWMFCAFDTSKLHMSCGFTHLLLQFLLMAALQIMLYAMQQWVKCGWFECVLQCVFQVYTRKLGQCLVDLAAHTNSSRAEADLQRYTTEVSVMLMCMAMANPKGFSSFHGMRLDGLLGEDKSKSHLSDDFYAEMLVWPPSLQMDCVPYDSCTHTQKLVINRCLLYWHVGVIAFLANQLLVLAMTICLRQLSLRH